jgi:hypothetical protein
METDFGKEVTTSENQSHQQSVVWRHPPTGVRWRMKVLVWRALPKHLVRPARRLLRFWYALRGEGRSFLGHMNTLLAKKHWGIDLGLEFQMFSRRTSC